MNGIPYFFWLAEASLGAGLVLLFPFAFLGFLGLVIASLANSNRPEAMHRKWRWLLLPFLMPVIILIYGVIFQHTGRGDPPDFQTRVFTLEILVCSHLPIAILFMVFMRRNFLVPLGISLFQGWLSLSAAAMAGMSVTGDWL